MMIDIDLKQNWKKLVFGLLAAGILAVVVSVIVGLFRNQQLQRLAEESEAERERDETVYPTFILDELDFSAENLLLPPIVDELWYGVYTPVEKRRLQWGMEDLRKYLYDPREIGTESLRNLNRKQVEDLLKEYE